jgi:hypothetical protein
MNEMKQTYLL